MESQAEGAPEAPVEPPTQSPYSTLWMPLVIVPAVIVIVLVLIFLMFGGIAGGPTSIQDNLQAVVTGGKNEREQAAFHLSQKVAENSQAALEGEELPWPVPADLEAQLQGAWESVPEDDVNVRFLLASLFAEMGDPEGVTHLIELLKASVEGDPGNELQFQIIAKLGALGDPAALEAVLPYAESPDAGLRSLVAIVLQNLGGEAATAALEGLLNDAEFEVRANAAISLSKLGSAAGVSVLLGLLEPEVYAAENAANRERFRTGRSISESRMAALSALARLGRLEDRSAVEAWKEDSDLEFRAVVLDALATWGDAGSAR
jgi:HEAT repeat protein